MEGNSLQIIEKALHKLNRSKCINHLCLRSSVDSNESAIVCGYCGKVFGFLCSETGTIILYDKYQKYYQLISERFQYDIDSSRLNTEHSEELSDFIDSEMSGFLKVISVDMAEDQGNECLGVCDTIDVSGKDRGSIVTTYNTQPITFTCDTLVDQSIIKNKKENEQ